MINDSDVAPYPGDSRFSEVLVYEAGQRGSATPITIDPSALVAYGTAVPQDRPTQGTVSVAGDRRGLTLTGNRWQALPLNYLVTPQTVLEFRYASSTPPEIGGIGLDRDLTASNPFSSVFTLAGTQAIPEMDNTYRAQYLPATAPGDVAYDRVEVAYDALHRPHLKTDQLGDTTAYVYDLAGRLTIKQYAAAPGSPNAADAGQNDTFTYDKASRPLTAASERDGHTVTMTYTTDGLLASETTTGPGFGPAGRTILRGYDQDDRLIYLTYPNGTTVRFTYTARDQLDRVYRDPDGPSGGGAEVELVDHDYDAARRETFRGLGNGLNKATAYARQDHLPTSIDVSSPSGPLPGALPGLSWSSYEYDANKNLTAATTGGPMSGYSFTTEQDAEDRLTNWLRTNAEQQNFGLSLVGDWNTTDGNKLVNGVLTPFGETRTHNPVHEITSIDDGNQVAAVAHDAKGNLTLDEAGNTYTWDFDNRLKEVRNSTGDLLASHTYDALGRRTTTTAPGSLPGDPPVVTAYVCMTASGGMGQLLAEYEDNALKRLYTYGSYIDEPLTLTRFDANLPGGEETLYYHRDRQYNLIGLTSGGGALVERYAYTPYGERRVLDPDGVTVRQTSAAGNPLGHQGLYHDDETGLIYNRARYREAGLGRWLGRDRLGYVDGLHTYSYIRNQVNKWLDPSGLAVLIITQPAAAPKPMIDTVGPGVGSGLGTGTGLGPGIGVPPMTGPIGPLPGDGGLSNPAGSVPKPVSTPQDWLNDIPTAPVSLPNDLSETQPWQIPNINDWPVDQPTSESKQDEIKKKCQEDYIACLHTSLQGESYGNRCSQCRARCIANKGKWPKTTWMGCSCEYWKY